MGGPALELHSLECPVWVSLSASSARASAEEEPSGPKSGQASITLAEIKARKRYSSIVINAFNTMAVDAQKLDNQASSQVLSLTPCDCLWILIPQADHTVCVQ